MQLFFYAFADMEKLDQCAKALCGKRYIGSTFSSLLKHLTIAYMSNYHLPQPFDPCYMDCSRIAQLRTARWWRTICAPEHISSLKEGQSRPEVIALLVNSTVLLESLMCREAHITDI